MATRTEPSEMKTDARAMRRMLFLCSVMLGAAMLLAAYIARPPRYVFLWPDGAERPVRFDIYSGKAQIFFTDLGPQVRPSNSSGKTPR